MYKVLIKPFFFLINPETIHHFVLSSLKVFCLIPGMKKLIKNIYVIENEKLERKLFGLSFKNPVGLAAGFDKNARVYNELSCFGFGFIEIGTVTPKPQPGNLEPRIFRLASDHALINRLGFNNDGVDIIAARLRSKNKDTIIGGNIGKNKITPMEEAVNDYSSCFETLYDHVDYFVVNVSSPNTRGLRDLQEKEELAELLGKLQDFNRQKAHPKPILLKIAPDLTNDQLDEIIEVVFATRLDGIIATNTTIDRSGLKTDANKLNRIGEGGLSGKPLRERSTEIIRYLAERSQNKFKIIGVGGIHSPEDAIEKLNAGADLVQVYTGFIYEGPGLIKKILYKLLN
ncbi:quinone-dependent dihydroorotate dehydrogenase [Candidatus Amoebophilus asiaticus]|nr:quinone-dependent dihydroorotate dehydrogenase [Candidatus Amoebophilus asiaticus]